MPGGSHPTARCSTIRISSTTWTERWIDFDLGGHQITAHLISDESAPGLTNPVDGDDVPVRHFGLVLGMVRWRELAEQLRAGGAHFLLEPRVRFEGQVGEQATLFVADGCGNALEFKAFADPSRLFQG